jgi:hypothetical protein
VLFTVLCGSAGSGKGSAKDVVRDLVVELFPNFMLSDSIQSREDIAAKLASPECPIVWKNIKTGQLEEYRPFFLLINEFAGFFSVDCRKMIEMLVDLYDCKDFSVGFKKDRAAGLGGFVHHPFVPMLGCVQPKWFMSNMKVDLFDQGLGRRMIIVNREKEKLNHDPKFPEDSTPGWCRVLAHLKRISGVDVQGQVKLNPEAQEWWKDYYYDKDRRKKSNDPILVVFQETEHMMLLRVALILTFCEYDFKYIVTPEHLQMARVLLDGLKEGVMTLTGGIGTNPMAGVIQLMEQYVKMNQGMVREVLLRKNFMKQCPRFEDFDKGLAEMQKVGSIVAATIPGLAGNEQLWIFTPDRWKEFQKGKK